MYFEDDLVIPSWLRHHCARDPALCGVLRAPHVRARAKQLNDLSQCTPTKRTQQLTQPAGMRHSACMGKHVSWCKRKCVYMGAVGPVLLTLSSCQVIREATRQGVMQMWQLHHFRCGWYPNATLPAHMCLHAGSNGSLAVKAFGSV